MGFKPFPVADLHMHLSLNSEQSHVGDADEVLRLLREGGLAAINVPNIVLWMTRNLPRNPISLLLKLRCPGHITSFAGPRYPMPDAADKPFDYLGDVRRLWELGFDGIKLYAKPTVRNAFGVPLDSPVFDAMFDWLQAAGIPVLYHVSDPPEFWDRQKAGRVAIERGWYCGDGGVTFEELLAELLRLLAKYPKLRLVVPHFMFLSQELPRLSEILQQYPAVSIDITPGVELYKNLGYNVEQARDFFLCYAKRILFGTDNTGTAYHGNNAEERLAASKKQIVSIRAFLEAEQGEVHGLQQACLALPDDVLKRIYYENFAALVGAKPRPVNKGGAADYTEEMLALAKKRADAPDAETILGDTLKAIEGVDMR